LQAERDLLLLLLLLLPHNKKILALLPQYKHFSQSAISISAFLNR
jgi:hypothetical protein